MHVAVYGVLISSQLTPRSLLLPDSVIEFYKNQVTLITLLCFEGILVTIISSHVFFLNSKFGKPWVETGKESEPVRTRKCAACFPNNSILKTTTVLRKKKINAGRNPKETNANTVLSSSFLSNIT